MTYFDALADESYGKKSNNWLNDARYARRYILNEKVFHKKNGKINKKDGLTYQREVFLRKHAVKVQEKDLKDEIHSPQGPHKILPCEWPNWLPESSVNLSVFPRFSARLLLKFQVLTPLLTRDDDPFYLFDNPARKDHLFGMPYLSAASVKGLSADAYQRAFPSATPWTKLSKSDKDPDRTRAFRHADPHARRLFGIADDGAKIESEKGRLHFSSIWFNNLQLLVMNPGDPTTAMGTQPIQFEAIAPGQTGLLEVVYFNPYGVKDSDEATVRADLARWLAAVASWWPALGLGAKRLAGYGAIQIEGVELRTVGWGGVSAKGENSWLKLARWIAGEKP